MKIFANGKMTFLFFIATAYMSLVTFPRCENRINILAGAEISSLDGRLRYNHAEVISTFELAGSEARNQYARVVRITDSIFPIIYGLFFICAISFFVKGIHAKTKWMNISIVPLGAMLFDFLENINTLKMLHNYPNISTAQVAYGSMMTSLKWFMVLLSTLILIFSMCIFLWNKYIKN